MSYQKALFSFILIFVFAFQSSAQNFDIDLLRNINHAQSDFKDNFFKFTSNSVIYVNIAAPLGVLTAGLINHDKKLQRDAAFMAGGFLVSSIVTQGLKNNYKKRPAVYHLS